MDENLVVVRGGSTPDRDGFDDPWPPLDSFQAPYRKAVRREIIKIVLYCRYTVKKVSDNYSRPVRVW